MSMRLLGDPIAGSGNLYAWGEGQIIKLYGEGVPEGFPEWLGQLERALYEAGLPVPAVGELVEIDGQLGQVYERIVGQTMADAALARAGTDSAQTVEIAHLFAEVHARIHDFTDLPTQLILHPQGLPEPIGRAPGLPPELKQATLAAFHAMPQGDRLCHGDFHPYNVLLAPRGPVVIDWPNAHIGDPLEDVARTKLMLDGAHLSEPELAHPPYRTAIERFNQAYLERYFQLRPDGQARLDAWRPIVAAVRLNDRIPGLQEWLLEQIRDGLAV